MSATAPLDVDTESVSVASTPLIVDDLVIIDDAPIEVIEATVAAPSLTPQEVAIAERRAIMPFVYLGVATFLAIITLSAILALG